MKIRLNFGTIPTFYRDGFIKNNIFIFENVLNLFIFKSRWHPENPVCQPAKATRTWKTWTRSWCQKWWRRFGHRSRTCSSSSTPSWLLPSRLISDPNFVDFLLAKAFSSLTSSTSSTSPRTCAATPEQSRLQTRSRSRQFCFSCFQGDRCLLILSKSLFSSNFKTIFPSIIMKQMLMTSQNIYFIVKQTSKLSSCYRNQIYQFNFIFRTCLDLQSSTTEYLMNLVDEQFFIDDSSGGLTTLSRLNESYREVAQKLLNHYVRLQVKSERF